MKKLWIPAALGLAAIMPLHARTLTVKNIEPVQLPQGLVVSEAVLSPDGNYMVMADVATTALTGINLNNGTTRVITDNGSILDLKMSADGSNVVYRQRVTDAKRRSHTALKATNSVSGKTVEIEAPSRNFNGFSLSPEGAVATLVTNADATPVRKSKTLAGNTVKQDMQPVVGISRGDLVVTVAGKTTVINPQGKGSYLWPSISPDGKKIVYYKAQAGCFVCNLDGSNPVALGYIQAPKWFGSDTVIGMRNYDNGTYVTESAIVANDLKGHTQTLTGKDVIAMYPNGSVETGRIVFADPMGQVYMITVE